MPIPTDVLIGTDNASFFRPYFYKYLATGALYCLMSDTNTFLSNTAVRMYKSTDGGATWAALLSTLSSRSSYQASGPVCLIGTKLYVYYMPAGGGSAVTTLAYFDFTADTFTVLTTTGSTGVFSTPFLEGNISTQFYVLDAGGAGGFSISQYVSNTYSTIATVTSSGGTYSAALAEDMFLGASGLLHVFYKASRLTGGHFVGDLGYVQLASGALVGSFASTIVLTAYQDYVQGSGSMGRPLQIGSNILFSFYDPIGQAVKLCTFTDVSTPTFTISVIDPSLPITPVTFSPTGAVTNVLGVFGSTLYCFYTNTRPTGAGDGNLYFRTSTDGGVTWSARQTGVTHLDPHDLTPFGIWMPEAMQFVGTPPGSVPIVPVTYLQDLGNSQSPPQNGQTRFFANISPTPAVAKNYVF